MVPEDASEPLVQPIAPAAEAGSSPPPTAAAAPEQGRSGRGRRGRTSSENMLPQRERRRTLPERMLVRLIATCGIVGIGVAIGAIMTSAGSQGWIVGLVVAVVSVVLAAVLWSSRML
jgi:amino acid permease